MIVGKKGKDFEPHPLTPDPIRAVVVDYTEPKKKQTQWGEKEKFAIVFETEMQMADGTHYTFWSHGYTPNISDKSNLARDLKKILGVSELPDDFDMETIIGKPVRLLIEHKKDGEQVYANLSYLGAHKGENPMKPSGAFVRERDREKNDGAGKAEYNKIPETTASPTENWFEVKVHVGAYAGHSVADLPSIEAVDKLLKYWWPTVEAKPSADDKRLIVALRAAKAAAEAPKATPAAAY